jgi:anti-sigma regulatory factor (Ser/Thr protein kinase)
MQSDPPPAATAGPRARTGRFDPEPDELERLRATCRRQAVLIDSLREAVATFSRGAKALKEENTELRAESTRLRGQRRFPSRPEWRREDAELAEVVIPLSAEAPELARGVVAGCLTDLVVPPVLENAQLLVVEMVTNRVRHSGAPEGGDLVVRVHLWRDVCRLEVEGIAPQRPDRSGGPGWGLDLVQLLSDRWGVVRTADGATRVWAQLSSAPALRR